MYILGIMWELNSTVSLFKNGEVLNCISEERFTRTKNDERYPINAINWILKENNIAPKDLDKIVIASTQWGPGYILTRHGTTFTVKDRIEEQKKIWKPRLFEGKNISILDVFKHRIDYDQFPGKTFWENIIRDLEGDNAHVTSPNNDKIGKDIRIKVLKEHLGISNEKIYFADHSTSHATYAYYTTPIEERLEKNLVLTLDAYGDRINYSARVFTKEGDQIYENLICQSGDCVIARLYRYITLILGLKPGEHEYKVMGLAPYCKKEYYSNLLDKFKTIQDVDGIHFKYLNKPADMYFSIKEMIEGERFDTISGALQAYTEYLLTKWVENLVSYTNVNKISFAGGVAMNVKANMLIAQLDKVEYVHIPPCPDDTSLAIGAVQCYLHKEFPKQRITLKSLKNIYLGKSISTDVNKLKECIFKYKGLKDVNLEDFNIQKVASLISEGNVIGRICGSEEFGARALGNRSILADPRKASTKKIINEKVKNRDFWMPFACTVLESHASNYFNVDSKNSSYTSMTLCSNTNTKGENDLIAAIHPYDLTCRPQVLLENSNPEYELLIKEFGNQTGVYALLNTSLNLHGLPIASTIQDALEVFFKSELDGLIIDNLYLSK